MRYTLAICLFALALPVRASDPGSDELVFTAPTWEGKHSDDLIATWGEPNKTKRHGEGGKLFVYRLRFFGPEMIGDTVIDWNEARCETDARNSVTPRVTATQKVKFYVDAEGIVRDHELAPRKWKQKRP